MKGNFLAVLSLSVILFACSKENNAPQKPDAPAGKPIPVRVSVADFLQKLETLPSPNGRRANTAGNAKDSSLNDITDIYFYIFNADAYNVASVHQQSTDAAFGVINEFLPSGSYNIVAMASSAPLNVYEPTFSINPAFDPSGMRIIAGFPDIFRTSTSIYVNEGDTATAVDLQLARRTSFLQVNFTDSSLATLPDSAITVKLNVEYISYDFRYDYGYSTLEQGPLEISRRNASTFNSFVLNTTNELSVDITYPDPATNATLTKTIRHIHLTPNTRTILTGSLFATPPATDTPDNGFSIRVNNIWDPSEVINF